MAWIVFLPVQVWRMQLVHIFGRSRWAWPFFWPEHFHSPWCYLQRQWKSRTLTITWVLRLWCSCRLRCSKLVWLTIFFFSNWIRAAGWNGLAGTLPHELSEFSSTLSELNFDGGSISGPIPKSFEQLEKLEKLSLQDNCFTGTIPDFSKLRNLHTILLGNNNGLSGSLNEYCIGTERVGNMRNLYADCGNAIECDCCGCCDPDSFECCSEERGCFNTVEMKNGPEDTHIMAFDKVCLSEESKLWIKQECPCYIYQPPGSSVKACTMDCDAKGAIASAADLKSKYDNKP